MHTRISKAAAICAAAFTALYIAVFVYFITALPRSVDTGAPYADGLAAVHDAGPDARRVVTVCGTPFGIKMRSDGVMVVSVREKSPAYRAGIRAGDVILRVNGEEVSSNDEIAQAVQRSRGAGGTAILLRRRSSELFITLAPEDEDGTLKLGAYVRDSAAGIGTLTFCDPVTGTFGGLGHAVSDVTTGSAVPLGSGEIAAAEINGVIKGSAGSAGELCGVILPGQDIGGIRANTSVGVFGELSQTADALCGQPMPAARKNEVHTGTASVLTTVDSGGVREFGIEIERLNPFEANGSKAMIIRITDPELLELTGGIVRGMSGSPIIQDGMLAGAVTHVFVNDPTRGYGVFAETMLDEGCAA